MSGYWGYVSHNDSDKETKLQEKRDQLNSMKDAGQIKSFMELDDGNGINFEVVTNDVDDEKETPEDEDKYNIYK